MTPENWHYLIETIGVMVLAWIAYKQHEDSGQLKEVASKGDDNGVKMDVIHQMSNSRLLALQNKVETLTAKVGQLEGAAAGIKQERDRAEDTVGGPGR